MWLQNGRGWASEVLLLPKEGGGGRAENVLAMPWHKNVLAIVKGGGE